MPKSVTVNFEDGSSHVYDNVPDDVSDAQVQERAKSQFDKKIADVGAGTTPAAEVNPSAPAGAPQANPTGPVAPEDLSLGEKAIAGAQTAYQLAEEHPVVATGLAYGTGKVLSKVPGVAPAVNTLGETFIPKYKLAKNLMTGAENWAGEFANRNFANQSQALADLEHQVRQYTKAGQAVPEDLQRAVEKVRGKVAGPAPLVEPVVPRAPITPAPVSPVPPAMQGAQNIPQQIQRFAAQKVLGPLAEGAQAVLSHPLINNPVTRFVASKPVQGALLAMHSSDLGPPVPMKGPYKGMEINPNTNRPWTREELAAINGK